MTLKYVLQLFGIVAVLFTLFPFVAVDFWWIRIFDFPHTQLTILTFTAFIIYFLRFDIRSWRDYIFTLILAGCFIFQLGKIFPYTPFSTYELKNAQKTEPENSIRILVANVLQKNTHHELLLKEILLRDPNLILLTETNERWRKEITREIEERYPYKVEVPLNNTYGMLLYSNYRLINSEVKYLVDDSIPSIHSKIVLPSGEEIQLHAIHPTPPMPQHNPTSTDRDAEMMKVAKMAKKSTVPVIVTGDFNDVAWSQTTSLFQNVSGLLDPRKGRGFYNTYNANSWIMRWPLDHLFVSEEFRVLELRTGNDIESDHFPLYAHLSFEPGSAQSQKAKEPSPDEMKNAEQQIKNGEKENEQEGDKAGN